MRLNIYLVRHADASKTGEDSGRPITPKGEQQAKALADWCVAKGIDVKSIICSPFLRTQQTAAPIGKALDVQVKTDDRLAPGAVSLDNLKSIVGEESGDLMIVSHEPDLSSLLGEMAGARTVVKKAGLARLECDVNDLGAASLLWVTSPNSR
jgi:phosphohistidine phosphatase SixA